MKKILFLIPILPITLGAIVLNNKSTSVARHCVSSSGLPDHICTPGSINTNVTQNNIHSTICVTGWTKTIRPSLSYTNRLKRQSIKDYGYVDTIVNHYEEDHLIPLELGGAPSDLKNLWAEPAPAPNPKDAIENALRTRVCNGSLKLSDAQFRIANNWVTALN